MSWFVEQILVAAHLISGAAWFGALVYRTFFVDPKARAFFTKPGDYEHFALQQADGMRYVVAAALLVCGASGFALLGLHWSEVDPRWWTLMIAKSVIWLIAFMVFIYISWVYWPYRVFATEAEFPRYQRQGLLLALVMIAFAASGILAGQLARSLPLGAQASSDFVQTSR